MTAQSGPFAQMSPLHPHEPAIPPAIDAEGRCHVCRLQIEVEALTNERQRQEDELTIRAGQRRERNEVFVEVISDYERLRGYVWLRHDDKDADPRVVSAWMAANGGGVMVEGIPEADEWRGRFWQ